jgi:hypothetical protein
MKALVLWCRWHDARLRLMGRSEDAVWGELAFPAHSQPFRFQLLDRILVVGEGDAARILVLDEMGVERPADH